MQMISVTQTHLDTMLPSQLNWAKLSFTQQTTFFFWYECIIWYSWFYQRFFCELARCRWSWRLPLHLHYARNEHDQLKRTSNDDCCPPTGKWASLLLPQSSSSSSPVMPCCCSAVVSSTRAASESASTVDMPTEGRERRRDGDEGLEGSRELPRTGVELPLRCCWPVPALAREHERDWGCCWWLPVLLFIMWVDEVWPAWLLHGCSDGDVIRIIMVAVE